MFYHEYPPPPPLDAYIRCFWMLEHDYREPFHTYEHLWADTHTELIFSWGERYYQKSDENKGRKIRLTKNFVIGPQLKQLLLYSNGVTALVAARFHPWGLTAFSKVKPADLVDKIIPAEEVLGSDNATLSARLATETARETKLQLFIDHLDHLLHTQHLPDTDFETIRRMTAELHRHHGTQRIALLARQFDISSRQLERQFTGLTGLSPKLFAKILRFNHARELIQENPDISLASVAYEVGYADQAHFSRNFRALFQFTPAQFKARIKAFQSNSNAADRDVAFVQD
jgi:AraC-like DNA-binding protein